MKVLLVTLLMSFGATSFAQWGGNIYQRVDNNTFRIQNLERDNQQLRQTNRSLQFQINDLAKELDNLKARVNKIEKDNHSPRYFCTLRDTSTGRILVYNGNGETEARARAEVRKACLKDRQLRPTQCNATATCRINRPF